MIQAFYDLPASFWQGLFALLAFYAIVFRLLMCSRVRVYHVQDTYKALPEMQLSTNYHHFQNAPKAKQFLPVYSQCKALRKSD